MKLITKQITLHRASRLVNEQDNSISSIRFVSMVMIITCHFMQYFEMELAWWFNVGVQIFFTMSGFLYGKKKIDKPIDFFCKQLRKILIPYWAIIIIVSIIHKLFFPTIFSWGKVISAVFCIGRISGMEHLWFVQYILICYLLLPYLSFLQSSIVDFALVHRIIIVTGLFMALQFVGFSFNGYGMTPNRVSCFVVGVILAALEKKKESLKWPRIIICLIAIALNAVKVYGMYIVKIEYNLIFDLFSKYAHGFLGIAIFLLLYWLFENIKGNVVLKISDRYSYYIYLVHQIFILGPLSFMKLTPNIAINMAIICCCILIAGILLEKEVRLINTVSNTISKNVKKRR